MSSHFRFRFVSVAVIGLALSIVSSAPASTGGGSDACQIPSTPGWTTCAIGNGEAPNCKQDCTEAQGYACCLEGPPAKCSCKPYPA